MDWHQLYELSKGILLLIALLAFLAVLIAVVFGIRIYLKDRRQTQHAILHNYPLIGHFRSLFETLGTFFRQYFFAMDREEMPFNRAQRIWVYRAAKDLSTMVAFGSTRDLRPVGTVFFVNCPYPTLESDSAVVKPVIIGKACRQPYIAYSLFNISGMSYGAISKVAVQALSHGAKRANCWYNTGEGGLSPYHLQGDCDIVFQIGTAKYGVRDEQGNLCDKKLQTVAAHPQVKMFEIKLSQGAKPGKGGILPGLKVKADIAAIRGIPEGEDSISPNRHEDINSAADLLNTIQRIRHVTGKPVGFKLVLGGCHFLDELFKEINERGADSAPDFITLDSSDGGTGASPQALMDYMGMPLAESLPMLVDHLVGYGLRERIKVVCSGKMITPPEVAWALCMGADFIVSARGFMFALGCIQAMQCNQNTCPTGVTTHNKRLQKGLNPEDKAIRVGNYVKNMLNEVGTIAHSCGVHEPRELKRKHAMVVNAHGHSVSLAAMYPDAKIGQPHVK